MRLAGPGGARLLANCRECLHFTSAEKQKTWAQHRWGGGLTSKTLVIFRAKVKCVRALEIVWWVLAITGPNALYPAVTYSSEAVEQGEGRPEQPLCPMCAL